MKQQQLPQEYKQDPGNKGLTRDCHDCHEVTRACCTRDQRGRQQDCVGRRKLFEGRALLRTVQHHQVWVPLFSKSV
ncbi:hypothetical protein CEXT_277051 [Caerostris extrusa]|uniref:Uncharacterized protein n=1 Tax=Caerostris extrusa TaxID=172846 RepID=A0AAV4WKF7_CAEEX|nr:hypothetical protein CEXT_277051 [Caerostris extrusa]